jgi:rod shape-determining protein MreC
VAVYSVGRRRVILILLLTSVLLLTIDLRGNAAFDRARILFDGVLSPLESAARVVTNPVRDAWRGATEYDELRDENARLQQRIDQQLGAEIAARNVIVENQQLLALNDLESIANLPTATAQVIGEAPSNLDQLIEIDVGSDQQVAVGMAVVNEAGLVGKVHRVFPTTSFVMLVTDPRYSVQVKVLSEENPTPSTTVPDTVPSGIPVDDVTTTSSTTTTTSTTSTTLPGESTDTTDPTDDTGPDDTGPDDTGPPDTSDDGFVFGTTTTSTTLVPPQRDTGGLSGRGADRLPRVEFIDESAFFGEIEPGDAVYTTGGRASLAPPDIPVGVVVNEIPGSSTGGVELEIELLAQLDRLQFVRVVLFKPLAERGE